MTFGLRNFPVKEQKFLSSSGNKSDVLLLLCCLGFCFLQALGNAFKTSFQCDCLKIFLFILNSAKLEQKSKYDVAP